MARILYIVTIPLTAHLHLRGQLQFLREHGHEIGVASSPGNHLQTVGEREGVITFEVPMERDVAVIRDLISVWNLFRIIRKFQPTIVNASTPKAGLLGMVASRLASVPIRVYSVLGLRLETLSGFKRLISRCAERVASACAHEVVFVSESLRQNYVDMGLALEQKAVVLANGSLNGLDIRRFLPTNLSNEKSIAMRQELGIPDSAPVIGFVGRLTRDKGIVDLMDSFDILLHEIPEAYLLVVGAFEEDDPVPEDYIERLRTNSNVIMVGFAEDTAPYYHIFDVFVFPSYREGFPVAPLEAAAAGIPVVAFSATGTIDVVVDGVSGMLVPLHDTIALTSAISTYISNPELRTIHGIAGQERVLHDYQPEVVWEALYREYDRLLNRSFNHWL